MKYYQQLDISDCGAACLAMIASKYDKYSSIAKIRETACTDIIGTNLKGMLQAGENLGFNTYAVKGTIENLNKKTPIPFIAHIHVPDEQGYFNEHFVVIANITKKYVYVWNPDATAKKKWIKKSEFEKTWSGYVIFLEPKQDFKPERDSGKLLLKFLPILKPHKKTLLLVVLCALLLIIFGIVTSFYYRYIFDEIIVSKAKVTLATLSIGVLAVGFFQIIISAIRSVLLAFFSFKSEIQLDFSYLKHIFNLPLNFFESRKTGEILSRLQDLARVRNTLSSTVITVFLDCFMIIIIIPILLTINKKLFFIDFSVVLVSSLIAFLFSKIFKKIYGKSMSKNAEVDSFLVERLTGISTIKALNAETKTYNDYENKKLDVIKINWKGNKYSIIQTFLSGMVSIIANIAIYWVGCNSIIDNQMSLGALISFNALAGYFTGPVSRLVNLQVSFQQAFVAADRVGEILDLATEEERLDKKTTIPDFKGHIQCKHVLFRYGSKPAIYQDFNIDIPAGTWAAFVGPSGCGKTTLVKLLLKFYSIEQGRIEIDDYDINDIDPAFLREKIGYVPQDIFLFSGTIQENIALHCPDATYEQILEASKKSGAHEFIDKLPQRYNTYLGQNGSGLSGGEKQKIALARALLGNPSMLILDEATSNLDSISEQSIYEVIKGLRSESLTVILIAHRLTTVKDCDVIYVMDHGRVIEQGNHESLMKNDGLYKELWKGIVI